MNITLRQLKAFITVADCGSFTRAAETLCLTQSALSGLIKELENNLGLRLFDRTTRQLHLSASGGVLLPQAQRILQELDMLDLELHNLKSRYQGQVKIAVSQQLAASALPDVIAAFCRKYEDIRVNLLDCDVEQVLERVQNNEADFGIGPERTHGIDIESEKLFSLPFYLVMQADNPLASRSKVCWRDLTSETLIALNSPFTDRLAAALPAGAAEMVLHPTYRVNFLSTALGMTRVGLGVTFCLPYAADWVRQHGLLMKPLYQPRIERSFYLYCRRNRSLSVAAGILNVFLKEYIVEKINQAYPASRRRQDIADNKLI